MLHHCDDHIEKPAADEDKKDEDKEKEAAPEGNTEGDSKEAETKEEPKKVDDTYQAFAVLGIVMIAMGEDIGSEMCLRQLNHLVRH
jgi:26S proteasome regulatory subunit N1